MDIQHFVSLIRKYKTQVEVSDLMFAELIDKIVVYEAEGVGKARTQKVDIYQQSDRSILPTPRRNCRDNDRKNRRNGTLGKTA